MTSIIGLRVNGEEKLFVNRYHGHPDVQGRDIIEFCIDNKNNMEKIFNAITIVNEYDTPTEEEMDICESNDYGGVLRDYFGNKKYSRNEWKDAIRYITKCMYKFRHLAESNIPIFTYDCKRYLEEVRYMYIINCDTKEIEFYYCTTCGNGQKEFNRYYANSFYYPELFLTIPFDRLECSTDLIVHCMCKSIK